MYHLGEEMLIVGEAIYVGVGILEFSGFFSQLCCEPKIAVKINYI